MFILETFQSIALSISPEAARIGAATGDCASGASLATRLTKVPISTSSSAASGAGFRSGSAYAGSTQSTSSQAEKASGARIAGIRSCKSPTRPLAAVVTMQAVSISPPLGSLQVS